MGEIKADMGEEVEENSVCWYHHMLKIQDGYMLRRCINCMLRVKGCGGGG